MEDGLKLIVAELDAGRQIGVGWEFMGQRGAVRIDNPAWPLIDAHWHATHPGAA